MILVVGIVMEGEIVELSSVVGKLFNMKKKYSLVMAAISIGMSSLFGIASDRGAKNQSEQLTQL